MIVGGDQDTNTSTTAEVFDPANRTFQAAGEMAPGRILDGLTTSTVPLKDGRVLVVGSIGFDAMTVSAQVFDPRTNTFTKGGTTSVSRDSSLSAAPLPDGRAIVLGGERKGIVEAYDASAGSFSRLASMPKPMDIMSCTALEDGRVLVLGTVIGEPQPQYGMVGDSGGFFDPLPPGGDGVQAGRMTGPFIITGELYDPTTNRWTVVGQLNDQRSGFAVVALHDGRALVIGGATDTAEFFDPKTGKFTLNH